MAATVENKAFTHSMHTTKDKKCEMLVAHRSDLKFLTLLSTHRRVETAPQIVSGQILGS